VLEIVRRGMGRSVVGKEVALLAHVLAHFAAIGKF
jgi:hypothetical protein